MKYKCQIFIDILLLIGAVYFFSMCSNGNRNIYNDDCTTNSDYNINHYIDTINGHVILTTVCDTYNSGCVVSVATLELK